MKWYQWVLGICAWVAAIIIFPELLRYVFGGAIVIAQCAVFALAVEKSRGFAVIMIPLTIIGFCSRAGNAAEGDLLQVVLWTIFVVLSIIGFVLVICFGGKKKQEGKVKSSSNSSGATNTSDQHGLGKDFEDLFGSISQNPNSR